MTGVTLFVGGYANYQATGAPSITDSLANTWVPLTAQEAVGVSRAQICYVENPTVGAAQTFTISGSPSYPACWILGFSGGKLASPFDQENGATVVNDTVLSTGSITPSEDNEVIVTVMSGAFAAFEPVSIDGGFTLVYSENYLTNGHLGGGIGYLIQTSAAAANPQWTTSASGAMAAVVASFKAAAAGGGPTQKNAVFGEVFRGPFAKPFGG